MSRIHFYDAVARRYRAEFPRSTLEYDDRLVSRIRALCDGPMLCIGVGTGREAQMLVSAGESVCGVDVSPAMVAECRRLAPQVAASCADATLSLPYQDHAMGAVLALDGVLHHMTDAGLQSMMGHVARVLRPGGRFVAEVVHDDVFDRAVPRGATFAGCTMRAHPVGLRTVDSDTGAYALVRRRTIDRWLQLLVLPGRRLTWESSGPYTWLLISEASHA